MSLKPILVRVAAGETSAVHDCVVGYGALVWSIAHRYLRNRADAEEVVQEVFLDIWRSAHRYDPEIASETAFIVTIARRRVIDRVRKLGHAPVTTSLDEHDEELPPPALSVPSTLENDAEVDVVDRIIRAMDETKQRVLSMSLYGGYSHREISSRLNLPLGSVKTLIRRGLLHIRSELRIAWV